MNYQITMNTTYSSNIVYRIFPKKIGFDETNTNKHIELTFIQPAFMVFKVIQQESTRSSSELDNTRVVLDSLNTYSFASPHYSGDDKLIRMICNSLAANTISQPDVDKYIEYIFKNVVLNNPTMVQSLRMHFPGYLEDYTHKEAAHHAETVIEHLTPDKMSDFYEEALGDIFNGYVLDEETMSNIKSYARQDLNKIVSRLKTNIESAKKNLQNTLQGHILRAMVSSNTR